MDVENNSNTLFLGAAKRQKLEQELSHLNSQLSTALEAVAAELEKIERLSDAISTLYETL